MGISMMASRWQRGVSLFTKGIGTLIGECVFGLYGPFLFSHFGLSEPGTIFLGVITGGVVGYSVGSAVSHFRSPRIMRPHRPSGIHA